MNDWPPVAWRPGDTQPCLGRRSQNRLEDRAKGPPARSESAALLLGGVRGAKLARELEDELSSGDAVSRRFRRRLGDLLELFALEHVGEPDREEAAYFARIDPSSPVVEEICLLTDMFRDAYEQAALDQPPASQSRTAA